MKELSFTCWYSYGEDFIIDARLVDEEYSLLEEATLKRVYLRENSLTLAPENLNYKPIHLTGEDMSNVSILGKVVGYVRYF